MKNRRIRRQEETVARFLKSAENLIAENGYGGISLEAIAEDAGYTRGAFYVNFAGKDDLLLSATESILNEHIRRAEEMDVEAEEQTWFDVFPRDGKWLNLVLEAWLLAQRDNIAKSRMADLFRKLRGRLGKFVRRASPSEVVAPLSAGEIGSAMIALRAGLLIQRRLDPNAVPAGTYGRIVAALLQHRVGRDEK